MEKILGWSEYALDPARPALYLKYSGPVGTEPLAAEVELSPRAFHVVLHGRDNSGPQDTAVNAGLQFGWVEIPLPSAPGDLVPRDPTAPADRPPPVRFDPPARAQVIPITARTRE
jgi:hypothetical protein